MTAYKELRLEIIKKLGGKCVNCGIADPRVLDFNHIIPVFITREKRLTGKKLYEDLMYHTEKYNLLCKNCNWIHLLENHNKINENKINEAKKLRKEGLTYDEIALKLGFSKKSFGYIKVLLNPVSHTSLEKFNPTDYKNCSVCKKYSDSFIKLNWLARDPCERSLLSDARKSFHDSHHRATFLLSEKSDR